MDRLRQLLHRVEARAKGTTRHYTAKYIADFARILKQNSLILDVGGGKKPYRACFPYQRYNSIDVNPEAGADIVADTCSLPFGDSVADAVLCTQVLEHVQDPSKALRELRRIIKDDGYLILSTPLMIEVHAESDFFRWTERGLQLFVKGGGFDILKMEKIGGVFSCLARTLMQTLFQVFAPPRYEQMSSRTWLKYSSWLKYGILFVWYLLFIPAMRVFIFLDAFDGRRDFTLGYILLARKSFGSEKET